MPEDDGESELFDWVGIAVMFSGECTPVWMLKSKSTPIRSKKVSLSRMNRTSIVTWRSCSLRSCSSRSVISSCTSCVWLTTMLRFVANGWMAPWPPTVFQLCGETVFWIRSMSDWKSAWLPPPVGAPNGMDGVEPVAGALPPP